MNWFYEDRKPVVGILNFKETSEYKFLGINIDFLCSHIYSDHKNYIFPCMHPNCTCSMGSYMKNNQYACNKCGCLFDDMIYFLNYFVEPIMTTFQDSEKSNFKVLLSPSKLTDIEEYIQKFVELNLITYQGKSNYDEQKDNISNKCRKWIMKNYIDSIEGIKTMLNCGIEPGIIYPYEIQSVIEFITKLFKNSLDQESIIKQSSNKKCKICKIKDNEVATLMPCGCKLHHSCVFGYQNGQNLYQDSYSNNKNLSNKPKFEKIPMNVCPGCNNPLKDIIEKLWDEMIQIQIVDKEMVYRYLMN